MEATDFPFVQLRKLTEEQRTEAVKSLLAQGFSIGKIWEIAPSLLASEPADESILALPIIPI